MQNPIVLFNGKVLVGRNRLEACKLAEVQPKFEEWEGAGSPLEWVISQNMMRRHLSASQKAVIAFDLLPLLEKEAKERQRRSKGRGKKVAQSCATFSGIGKVSHIAARIAKSNSTYVEILKRVNAEAPRLFPKIRSGELTVPDAKRLINGDLNNHIRLHDLDEKSILKAATEIRQHQTAERNRKQQAQERRALARLSKKPRWTITAEQKVVKCHHTGLRRSSGSQTIWNHSLVVGATDGRNAGPISSPFFGARRVIPHSTN